MPSTYCSLHYHAVFSTKDRYPLITKDWRNNLHDLKGGSSEWVHQTVGKTSFLWQLGYFSATVSPSQVETVTRYILNQEEHHRHKSFQDEYLDMLKLAGIQYDERVVW